MYKFYLTKRLLTNANPDIEIQLLTSIPYKAAPEVYVKMVFQIHDARASNYEGGLYKNTTWNITSEKYKQAGITVKDLNRDAYKFHIKRSYAWDTDVQHNITLPLTVLPYFEFFTAFYNFRYSSYSIGYDLDATTFEITFELSNRMYQLELPGTVFVVLSHINEKGRASAYDIKRLGLSSAQLSASLNSLLSYDIIAKAQTNQAQASNDINMMFELNHACSTNDLEVSLVSVYNQYLNRKSERKQIPEIPEASLKTEIISTVIKHSVCTVNKVQECLKEKFKVDIPQNRIVELLESTIKSGDIVKTNDGTYRYNMKEISSANTGMVGDDIDAL
jgi:hypothetical protein